MSADPAPSAVEPEPIMCECGHEAEDHGHHGGCITYSNGENACKAICRLTRDEVYLATITALRAENGRLVAERDELANWIKRIRGQAEAAEAVIHGQKSTVNLEVEDTLPTAK